LLFPVLAGVLLRLWRLPDQVLADDEYHAVNTVLALGFPEILWTYTPSDHCLPLASLYRLWLVLGQPLTELVLRAPSLLAGLLLLVLMPRFVAGRLGRPTAAVLAWLLAFSPALVLYSRIARSYMLLVFLGAATLGAFVRWWEGGGARWAAATAGLSALTLYTHLGAGPWLVAPFLWAGGAKLVERWGRWKASPEPRPPRPSWAGWLAAGAATALAMAAPLVPAWGTLGPLIAQRRMHQPVGWDTPYQVLLLMAGAPVPWVALGFWALALGGLGLLLVRRPTLGWLTLTVVAVQVAGIKMLSPEGLPHPLIFNRYLLVTLPLSLLWVAHGLAGLGARLRRGGFPAGVTAMVFALLLLGWFLQGPLARFSFLGGSFAHHNMHLLYSEPPARPGPGVLPEAYRRLAAWPEGGAVLEVPWFWFWNSNLTTPLGQQVHRREVLVAHHLTRSHQRHLAFRNTLHTLEPEDLLASRARFLVLHRDPYGEEDAIVIPGWKGSSRFLEGGVRARLKAQAELLAGQLLERWGPPRYSDPVVAVWDLEAVRGAGRSSPSKIATIDPDDPGAPQEGVPGEGASREGGADVHVRAVVAGARRRIAGRNTGLGSGAAALHRPGPGDPETAVGPAGEPQGRPGGVRAALDRPGGGPGAHRPVERRSRRPRPDPAHHPPGRRIEPPLGALRRRPLLPVGALRIEPDLVPAGRRRRAAAGDPAAPAGGQPGGGAQR
jgi:hypothetical protein